MLKSDMIAIIVEKTMTIYNADVPLKFRFYQTQVKFPRNTKEVENEK